MFNAKKSTHALLYRSNLREFHIITKSICSWVVCLSNVQFSVWENGWDKLLKHHKIPLSYQDNLFLFCLFFYIFSALNSLQKFSGRTMHKQCSLESA